MNKLNPVALKLKLDRHKLKYNITDDNSQIQLGGSAIKFSFVFINIILPILIASIFIIATALGFIPYFKKLSLFIIIAPIIFGLYNLFMLADKITGNKNIKIISKDKIKIISNGVETLIESKDIDRFEKKIYKSEKSDIIEGKLFLLDISEKEHIILSIFENDKNFLEKDLDYFVEYFNMIINKS